MSGGQNCETWLQSLCSRKGAHETLNKHCNVTFLLTIFYYKSGLFELLKFVFHNKSHHRWGSKKFFLMWRQIEDYHVELTLWACEKNHMKFYLCMFFGKKISSFFF
jgi:hypothetical protein